MTPRRKLARGEGKNLREEILESAEQILLQSGSDEAVSIRSVANAVGVTAPSIYRHFADKDALIIAVCEKQLESFNAAMATAVDGLNDPLEELRVRGDTYIRFGLDHPEAYALMFMRPPAMSLGNRDVAQEPTAFMALVGSVERAIEASALRKVDAMHAAQVIWAAVHGLTSILIAQPSFPWSDRERLIGDILFAAIAPFKQG